MGTPVFMRSTLAISIEANGQWVWIISNPLLVRESSLLAENGYPIL